MRALAAGFVLGIAMLSAPTHARVTPQPVQLMSPTAPCQALQQRDRVTLEEAVRRVRQQYGGRIVSAETRGRGKDRVHVIKVLTDAGKVQTVRVAAN